MRKLRIIITTNNENAGQHTIITREDVYEIRKQFSKKEIKKINSKESEKEKIAKRVKIR